MAERIENHLFVFAGLSPEESKRLLQGSRLRRYAAGETVYRAGEPQRDLFLLLQGAVKLWVPQTRPLILEVVLPGESFGEFCQDGQGRCAEETEALEPSVVRAFPFARLLAGSPNGTQPTLGQRLLGLYCRRAAQARHLWRSGWLAACWNCCATSRMGRAWPPFRCACGRRTWLIWWVPPAPRFRKSSTISSAVAWWS